MILIEKKILLTSLKLFAKNYKISFMCLGILKMGLMLNLFSRVANVAKYEAFQQSVV